jgi:hypothetical protein
MKQERNAKCSCGSGNKYKKCCLPVELEKARSDKIEQRRLWLERAELRRQAREHLVDNMKGLHPTARGSVEDPVLLTLMTAMHGRGFRI